MLASSSIRSIAGEGAMEELGEGCPFDSRDMLKGGKGMRRTKMERKREEGRQIER